MYLTIFIGPQKLPPEGDTLVQEEGEGRHAGGAQAARRGRKWARGGSPPPPTHPPKHHTPQRVLVRGGSATARGATGSVLVRCPQGRSLTHFISGFSIANTARPCDCRPNSQPPPPPLRYGLSTVQSVTICSRGADAHVASRARGEEKVARSATTGALASLAAVGTAA